MSLAYLVLTDLSTPDETDMRVLASSIVAFGNDSRTHSSDFTTHFGYLDLVGGHTKLVCESAEEIQEKLIELYTLMEEGGAQAEAEYNEAISKALGLDLSDFDHTLAAQG